MNYKEGRRYNIQLGGMECTQLHTSSNVDALTCPVCRADPPAGCTVPVSRANSAVSHRDQNIHFSKSLARAHDGWLRVL